MSRISILLIDVLFSCTSNRHIKSGTNRNDLSDNKTFKVYKIDSLNCYYLIDAQKLDSLFKFVSKNKDCTKRNLINVGGHYPFLLKSIWNTPVIIEGTNVSPSSVYSVNCINFDDSTRICLERDSISDLYTASNVQGLCFIK